MHLSSEALAGWLSILKWLLRNNLTQLFRTKGYGYDYGNGFDGDKTLDAGTHYIEDLFPGYAPLIGQYPHFVNLALVNGARLTSRAYNMASSSVRVVDH